VAVGERDALGADGWILGDAFCLVNRRSLIFQTKKYRLAGGYDQPCILSQRSSHSARGMGCVLGLTDGLTLAILVFSAVSSH